MISLVKILLDKSLLLRVMVLFSSTAVKCSNHQVQITARVASEGESVKRYVAIRLQGQNSTRLEFLGSKRNA